MRQGNYALHPKRLFSFFILLISSFAYAQPEVTSISIVGDPTPGATSVDFQVTFSEAVNGVDQSDFTLNASSLVTGASISGFMGVDGDTQYTVTVSGIAGDGVLSVDLNDNGTGIIATAGGAPIAGGLTNGLRHYVGAAFDVSRAIYNGDGERFYVGGQETSPYSLAFSGDGTKMYVIGYTGDDINEYDLSTAYDVSTAVYAGDGERFSIQVQEGNPRSLTFNADGTKMYVVGSSEDINEYDLGTPYDVSTAVYTGDGERFHVGGQDYSPYSLAFNADGMKMYVTGNSRNIGEYDLSIAYDVSTAVYTGYLERFSVTAQESDPRSLTFNADGTRMYVMGSSGKDINEYDLGTPYDVSTAVYAGDGERFAVGDQDSSPLSLSFSADGTRMHVLGGAGDDINEYSLVNQAPIIEGALTNQPVNADVTINLFSTIEVSDPNNDFLTATITLDDNAKGTLTGGPELTGTGPYYIATPVDAAILQGYLQALVFDPTQTGVTTFTLQINDGTLDAIDNATTVDAFDNPLVTGISLIGSPSSDATSIDFQITFDEPMNGVDVSDFVLQISSLVQANLSGITGVDGDAMYTVTISGITGDGVVGIELLNTGTGITDATGNALGEGIRTGAQHVVGYAFDVSKAAYNGDGERFDVGGQEINPHSLSFNGDGTKMYVMGNAGDDINEYDLSTAYDVSTAVYTGDGERFSVVGQENFPTSLSFNTDGTKMYVMGTSSRVINEYDLSTPYDVSTAVYAGDGERFSVQAQEYNPYSLAFNGDGTSMYVIGYSGNAIIEYDLSTAYDVSTAVYAGDGERFSVIAQESSPRSLAFNTNGIKMYVMGTSGDDINEYDLSTPYDVSTAVYAGDGERFYVGAQEASPLSLSFNADGTRMYVMGNSDNVNEYSLVNQAPIIEGVLTNQLVNADFTITLFSTIEVADPNNDLLTATITLDDNAKGALTGGPELTGTGPYYIATPVDAAILQGYLQALVFEPAQTGVTTFTLQINDGTLDAIDNATSVDAFDNPLVTDISLIGSPSSDATSVDFQLTFDEPVNGVDVSDFILHVSSLVQANLSGITGVDGDAMYTVTISGITGDGVVGIELLNTGTGIMDATGNELGEGIRTSAQHVVGYAFDVSKAAYNGDGERFYVGNQDAASSSLTFDGNGTRMYMLGNIEGAVNEYELGTPYDVSTAVYAGDGERFLVQAQESSVYSLSFNGDGTRMYAMGIIGDDINEYDLSTPYDVSTAVYAGDGERFSVGGQETSPRSLVFNGNGTKMYVMGTLGRDINEYDLSTAYDVSTAVYAGDGERFSVQAQESYPFSLAFSANGIKMYVMGTSGGAINEYDLSTAYDVSTAVYAGDGERFYVQSQESTPLSMAFNDDGTRMYVMGSTEDNINEYSLVNRLPIIEGVLTNQSVNVDVTINPFSSVVITDLNNDLLTATITLDDNANGTLTGGPELTGTGPYLIATPVDAVTLREYLRALVFDPTQTGITTFTLQISDGLLEATNNVTSVDAVDNPFVTSITLLGSPTSNATSIDFQITFDEPVNGVDISDLFLKLLRWFRRTSPVLQEWMVMRRIP